MKHLKIVILSLSISLSVNAFSQTKSTSKRFTINKAATINVADIKEDWNPVVQNIEMPKPNGNSEKQKRNAIKDSLAIVYPKKYKSTVSKSPLSIPAPFLGQNLQGNIYNSSTPNDNEIAISNDNKIISVQNATVFKYDINTGTSLGYFSLTAFATALANPNTKFDPKVIYDPIQDKFILVFLNGFTDTTSSITVAFSASNDPNGIWNMYELPGNPFGNGLWTDYPMIAMTDQELFITGNLLYPDSSWQTGFNESVIWQVNKNSGYSGSSIQAMVHHNITCVGKPVRNICPVKGGLDTYGPDMNFLSDRNLDPQNDTVFLVHLNDTIGALGQAITVTPLISPISYFMPPQASQPGAGVQLLETNDSRILAAFIENDKIQYVNNCLDTASGFAAVYHGIINDISTSPYITANIISDTLLELGYPNISYAGSGTTDQTSIISFDHTALTVFPGVSALTSDGNGNYSPITTVKSGAGFFSILSGNERWGDYSGSQRKYNQPGRVWVNGMWGSTAHKNITWIGELSLSSLAGISNPKPNNTIDQMMVYPNPTADLMNVSINLEKLEYLQFEVIDVTGKLLKVLLNDRVKAGKNNFNFSTAPLSKGIYFLKVTSGTKEILVQKFVKE
ncbi:MAG: T9SS type A sorting domain-containing protein [Bacteroidetes bacterium]|nr:T9SS type A sorting domain-containing protein [Bacteroidota bacterium]